MLLDQLTSYLTAQPTSTAGHEGVLRVFVLARETSVFHLHYSIPHELDEPDDAYTRNNYTPQSHLEWVLLLLQYT